MPAGVIREERGLAGIGGRSRYAEERDHNLMRRHFPAAGIEVIADSGHNPHMDKREDFVRIMINF